MNSTLSCHVSPLLLDFALFSSSVLIEWASHASLSPPAFIFIFNFSRIQMDVKEEGKWKKEKEKSVNSEN